MGARSRIALVVAVAAAAAAALTVTATKLTAEDRGPPPGSEGAAPARRPPLALDLGVRFDPAARALRRGESLFGRGRIAEARRIFAADRTPAGRVGAAIAAWPNGTVERLRSLAGERAPSALVELHVGLALASTGRTADAERAWRAAVRAEPDTLSAVRASNLLHPDLAPGLPTFVPTFGAPPGVARLRADRQLAALAAAARRGGARAKLRFGVALQRLGKQRSAERQYSAAARLAPGDPEALVAAAVGRFDKANPARAFSRLGPLTRRFPRAATVRFHLGLMLLWIGELSEARRQLTLARRVEPASPLAREAQRLLERL